MNPCRRQVSLFADPHIKGPSKRAAFCVFDIEWAETRNSRNVINGIKETRDLVLREKPSLLLLLRQDPWVRSGILL